MEPTDIEFYKNTASLFTMIAFGCLWYRYCNGLPALRFFKSLGIILVFSTINHSIQTGWDEDAFFIAGIIVFIDFCMGLWQKLRLFIGRQK